MTPIAASAPPAPHHSEPKHAWPSRAATRGLIAAALAATTLLALRSDGLPWPAPARIAVGMFALAIIAWTVLRLPDTPVALASCLALIGLGVATPQALYASLGSSLIWLLIGAFVIAAVLQQSGLAERWALQAVAGARTAPQLLLRLTWVIAATAFVVPSTSGRAALLLPVFLVLARAVRDVQVVRAMALLFPSVILLSACASLLGAGAHLVAVDFMRQLGQPAPSFALWAWWAAPFAVLSSLAATLVITALFLDRSARQRPLSLPAPDSRPLSATQWGVVAVTLLTVAAWASGSLHGVDATLVALIGALAITCKRLTGVDLKTALKRVEWNLVLFLAATLVLGEALLHSGAAQALADALLQAVPLQRLGTASVLLLAVVIALLSHLLIISRTARALVLLPTVALPLAATGLNPALLIFACVLGSGFCQTLAVSAKPVALFARTELPAELLDTRTPIDVALLRLSLALLPVMAALLWLFAWFVWPVQGLALHG